MIQASYYRLRSLNFILTKPIPILSQYGLRRHNDIDFSKNHRVLLQVKKLQATIEYGKKDFEAQSIGLDFKKHMSVCYKISSALQCLIRLP